jgi:gliding motility-associated-like protein
MTDTSYTVIGTDVNHCKDTAVSNVTVNASPIISVTNASVCIGSTATLTASGASTYTWSTGNTTASITATPTVVTNYTVSSSNGICTSSKIATVTILINHTHLLSGGTIGMCTGDSIKLQTNTTYPTYIWNTGQTTPTIEATHAGTYIVHTIDNNGCKGTDSVKVYEDSKVAIPLYDTTLCSGDSAHLQVTQGNYIYLWSPSAGLNNNTIYNPAAGPLNTTTYTVSVTNGGCINTNTVTIFVNPLPQISVKPDYAVVMQGENVAFQVQSSSTCYWYPSTWLNCSTCNTSTSTPYEDITYTITTTNNYGCSASTKVKIKIDFESTFYIPNTFTPNSDGRNETFKPAYTNIHNFKMNVFDRWGLLLFQTDNPDNGWDGMYKGKLCQEDVYVYKLEYRDDMSDSYHSLSGTVNIVR